MSFNRENIVNRTIQGSLAAMLGAGVLAICTPALAADVDINVRLPGAYQVPQPVYQQPQPVYVEPRPIIVRQQPVYVQRDGRDWDRDRDCKKGKCKYKKEKKDKKDKHGKHHGHDD